MDTADDCFNTIFSKEERDEIKLYAYNIGMNLFEIMPIIGIKIRDEYMKESGVNVEDVDKHAPKQA